MSDPTQPPAAERGSAYRPPYDEDAERAVIGAILVDPESVLREVAPILETEAFYREAHRRIYRAILDLDAMRTGIDIVTVAARLSDTGGLEIAGGGPELLRLSTDVPTTVNVAHYARIVRDKAMLRAMLALGQEIAQRSTADVENPDAFVDEIARRMTELQNRGGTTSAKPMKDALLDLIAHLERVQAAGGNKGLTGVPSGFQSLDRITSGWQPGDLIILAARPAMGKTAFALNLLVNAARDRRKPTAGVIFSLEMSSQQLAARVLASSSRVAAERIRSVDLDGPAWGQIINSTGELSSLRLFVDDTAQISVPELTRKCRALKQEHDLGLVLVDYLQLMKSTLSGKNSNREQEIAEISRGLKGLAKELGVPVIALSQLNRGVESRKDKRPMLSDLRESGAIEQDADIVMFLHREDYYRDEDGKPKGPPGAGGPAGPGAPPGGGRPADPAAASETEVILAKHRSGSIGTATLLFHPRYTVFADALPPSHQDDSELRQYTRVEIPDGPGPGAYPPPPSDSEPEF